jgi:hypothetical protein
LRLIRSDAKRQHRARRKLAPEGTSEAHVAVVAALDYVLDSLENLRQEEFQSEKVQAPQTAAAARPTRLSRAIKPALPARRRLLTARPPSGNRVQYQQILRLRRFLRAHQTDLILFSMGAAIAIVVGVLVGRAA